MKDNMELRRNKFIVGTCISKMLEEVGAHGLSDRAPA
jgi:hypothetical protein